MATQKPEYHTSTNSRRLGRRGEKTQAFLSRLQQVASVAFPKLPDDSRRERVLSKLVRSVGDPRLREELQMFGFIDESSSFMQFYLHHFCESCGLWPQREGSHACTLGLS